MRNQATKPKPDATMKFIAKHKLHHAVAAECGIGRTALYQWSSVPPRRVLAVAKVTGIPPHKICPALYPAPTP